MDAETSKGEAYEAEHVHAVYEEIASHFSSTRYKPWPIVERFLTDLPGGSIGLDIGCGNGKYLAVNPRIFILASDTSPSLVSIARQHPPHDAALLASALALPHPGRRFDFAISIAVVHHLSTRPRRIDALRTILATLRLDGGKALVYVWALEQASSRRGWEEGGEQDVMVPWVLKAGNVSSKKTKKGKGGGKKEGQETGEIAADSEQPAPAAQEDKVFQRYYHLYRKGELEEDVLSAGGSVVEAGYEKDNWWAVIAPGSTSTEDEVG